MSRFGKIARRSLLVGVAAVAGGAVYWYRHTPANPLLKNHKPGETTLNPYLRIDKEGVTIVTPHADVGQGAYSVQAALVAEELDLAWEAIRIEPAPASGAYYNSEVVAETLTVTVSERGATRMDDRTSEASMEKRKKEGYF